MISLQGMAEKSLWFNFKDLEKDEKLIGFGAHQLSIIAVLIFIFWNGGWPIVKKNLVG